MRAPVQPYTDPTNLENAPVYNKLWWLQILMVTTHITCVVAIVLPQFFFDKNPLIWQTITIFAMIMTVTNISFICECMTQVVSEDFVNMTLEY